MTYRQLCILSLIAQKGKYNLRNSDYRGTREFTNSLILLLQEISDLYNLGLINGGGDAYLGFTDVNPSKIELKVSGVFLLQLMELREIPGQDRSILEKIIQ